MAATSHLGKIGVETGLGQVGDATQLNINPRKQLVSQIEKAATGIWALQPATAGRLNIQPQAADRSICFEGVRQGLPGERFIRIKLQIMVGVVKRKEAFDLGAQDDFEIARTLENLVAE
jgi:hypothetical protein